MGNPERRAAVEGVSEAGEGSVLNDPGMQPMLNYFAGRLSDDRIFEDPAFSGESIESMVEKRLDALTASETDIPAGYPQALVNTEVRSEIVRRVAEGYKARALEKLSGKA